MEHIIPVILAVLLLILGFWFIKNNYRSYMTNWRKEITVRKLYSYGIIAVVKSLVLFVLIIVIHNYFHSDHRIELIMFILIYILLAIFQSAYSFGGFLSRIKYIFNYSINIFKKRSKDAETFRHEVFNDSFSKFSSLIRVLVFISFIIFFMPNITLFVFSNFLYVLLVVSLLLLSLVLNNIIYFGLISLIVFQIDPVGISFGSVNLGVLFLSYFIILIGIVIETRMDNRMFRLVASRMVKSLNFDKGYEIVYYRKNIVVYQNVINKNYYVYYRMNGIVTVFESMFDAKLTDFLVRKMIFKGTQYLRKYDIE